MVENDVETVLREIRERIYAEQQAVELPKSSAPSANGDTPQVEKRTSSINEAIARLQAHLTTTERAWDRLPPVVSNRSGASARLELWLKRHMRRATRWYAWEQINFNAAVSHSLRDIIQGVKDIVQALVEQTRELEALRQQLLDTAHQLESKITSAELKIEALESRVSAQQAQTDAQINSQRIATREDLEQIRHAVNEIAHNAEAQRSAILNEFREGNAHLSEEQRVCFKQLSLETSEAAALEDRARRKTQAELDELKRRLDKLESR